MCFFATRWGIVSTNLIFVIAAYQRPTGRCLAAASPDSQAIKALSHLINRRKQGPQGARSKEQQPGALKPRSVKDSWGCVALRCVAIAIAILSRINDRRRT
ncbi:hypothetical protein QBC44DRAFT_316122 [Cladorrhinum sp. PSN332]|nr:hypothetical protein QBC44DRAFT_316122 [Cladorrhinum sp. PSN332]